MTDAAARVQTSAFVAGVAAMDVDALVESYTDLLRKFVGTLDEVAQIVAIPDAATLDAPEGAGVATVQADLVIQKTETGSDGRRLRTGVRIVVSGYADEGVEGIFDIDVHAPTVTAIADAVFDHDPVIPVKPAAPARTVVTLTRTEGGRIERCGGGMLVTGYDCMFGTRRIDRVDSVLIPAELMKIVGDLHGDMVRVTYECVLMPSYGAITVTVLGGDLAIPTHVMTDYCFDGMHYRRDGSSYRSHTSQAYGQAA